MDRTDDILIPAETSWLCDPAARRVYDAVERAGRQIFFVGGCVRNALLAQPDSDVDLSTDALPQDVMRIAQAAGLKAIPTGIDHGTVTIVSDGVPFEVTTFRRDVATDGRRAVVAFSSDIAEDARRRDFTMNALYARMDGSIVDPLGGLPDALARRIRFIEDPVQRIREDYLRILRFFRFSAWYADSTEGFEPDTLAAISETVEGLEALSKERVGQEMKKILSAPDPGPVVAVMRQIGVLHRVLPGADDRFLLPLPHGEQILGIAPCWITRLAALGGADVAAMLRMSRADAQKLALIRDTAYGAMPLAEVAYRHGQSVAVAGLQIRAALAEREPDSAALEPLSRASQVQFPVTAGDLMPAYHGVELGRKLKALETQWIASDFKLSAKDLLS